MFLWKCGGLRLPVTRGPIDRGVFAKPQSSGRMNGVESPVRFRLTYELNRVIARIAAVRRSFRRRPNRIENAIVIFDEQGYMTIG